MIKIENTETRGWKTFITTMNKYNRNSDENDSWYGCTKGDYGRREFGHCGKKCVADCKYYLGEKDLKLLQSIKVDDNSKLFKKINVYCDITAPLYWWEELTYYQPYVTLQKFNLMDKIQEKEFTINDFSCENLYEDVIANPFTKIIDCLNFFRGLFLQEEDIDDYHLIQQLLPVSYNFKATTNFNYYDLKNIYFSKNISNKKEWIKFKKWIETLPYFKEICLED